MNQFFTDAERSEAAFQLLASAGVDRYTRLALRFSEPLAEKFQGQPALVSEAKGHALRLSQIVEKRTERTEEEFDLSLLVAALSRVKSAGWLLRTVANNETPGMRWPAALAKRLLKGSKMELSKAVEAWPRGDITLGELHLAAFNAIVADPRASVVAEVIASIPEDVRAGVEESIRMHVGTNARDFEHIQSLCVTRDYVPPARDYDAEQRAIEAIEEWAR